MLNALQMHLLKIKSKRIPLTVQIQYCFLMTVIYLFNLIFQLQLDKHLLPQLHYRTCLTIDV